MSKSVEDLQMLRLIKAFQKLKDGEARRRVLLFVEEQVETQQAKKPTQERDGEGAQ